jgi:drug/metabolite transporter superfamily protein YnfA
MTVSVVLLVIAALLAFVELVQTQARSLPAWGVMLIVAALLWGPRF